jgi:hypothetical protein
MVVPARQSFEDVVLHARPGARNVEALDELRAPAFVRPRRDDAGEVVVASRVGVNVRLDVDASPPRLRDERDDLFHASQSF